MHDVFLVQSKHLSDNLIIQNTQFPSIQKFVIKIVANLIIKKYTHYDVLKNNLKCTYHKTQDEYIGLPMFWHLILMQDLVCYLEACKIINYFKPLITLNSVVWKFCSKCIPEASTKRNNSFECLCCERKRKICTFAKKASNLSISRNLMSYIFSSFAFAYQDED